MEVGQRFMLDGKEYVRIDDADFVHVTAYPLKKNGEVSDVGKNIYISDYGRIKPIPMEK